MTKSRRRPRGNPLRVLGRAAADLVEAPTEQLAELEIVFELYCGLWDLARDMPPRDRYEFVLEELAESGASEELRTVLADLRRLPFVASAPGTMSDLDRTWFGLQILLNQLLTQGQRLLSPELLANLGGEPAAPTGTASTEYRPSRARS